MQVNVVVPFDSHSVCASFVHNFSKVAPTENLDTFPSLTVLKVLVNFFYYIIGKVYNQFFLFSLLLDEQLYKAFEKESYLSRIQQYIIDL